MAFRSAEQGLNPDFKNFVIDFAKLQAYCDSKGMYSQAWLALQATATTRLPSAKFCGPDTAVSTGKKKKQDQNIAVLGRSLVCHETNFLMAFNSHHNSYVQSCAIFIVCSINPFSSVLLVLPIRDAAMYAQICPGIDSHIHAICVKMHAHTRMNLTGQLYLPWIYKPSTFLTAHEGTTL